MTRFYRDPFNPEREIEVRAVSFADNPPEKDIELVGCLTHGELYNGSSWRRTAAPGPQTRGGFMTNFSFSKEPWMPKAVSSYATWQGYVDPRAPKLKAPKRRKFTRFAAAAIGGLERLDAGLCPTCGGAIGVFRDPLSEKEFGISGMCQSCQDSVFKPRKGKDDDGSNEDVGG